MERLQLQCPHADCSKIFGSKYNLTRHIRCCHLKIKSFVCEICGMGLASNQTKQEHLYIHSGEKPYRCDFPGCEKRYRQSSQLSVHKRVHMRGHGPQEWPRRPRRQALDLFQLPPVCEERRSQQLETVLPSCWPRY